jgi:hypothetical protein
MEENRVCDGGEYTKLTWPNFYTTSKFINMYSGCFEWKRVCDGGEYAKLTCAKFLRNLQIFTKPPKSYISIPVVLNGREPGL